MAITIGLILLVLLQIADLVTTHMFLKRGATEENPLARWALNNVGFWPLIVAKIVVTSAVIAAILIFPQLWPVLAICLVLQTFVVLNNLMVLDII